MSTKTQVDPEHYKRNYDTLERYISYYHQVESVLGAGVESLLEIGPGNGTVTEALRKAGVSVTTCDFDERLRPDVVADVRKLPFADKSFDAVMACQVLEHIPFGDFDGALAELGRVARNTVIISLPYRSSNFELVLKFPFIRSLLHRNYIGVCLRRRLIFPGFESSRQHYWEIDRRKFKMSRVHEVIGRHFGIRKEFSPVLNRFHYFFILDVHDNAK